MHAVFVRDVNRVFVCVSTAVYLCGRWCVCVCEYIGQIGISLSLSVCVYVYIYIYIYIYLYAYIHNA
jgi:hypothetical protein